MDADRLASSDTDAASGLFKRHYFAESTTKSSWHAEAKLVDDKIKPLLKALSIDARHDVEQTDRLFRGSVHARLRAATQLGRGDTGGMRVVVQISDYLPPPVLALLRDVPDELLWVVINLPLLRSTKSGIDAVISQHDGLIRLSDEMGFGIAPAREALEKSAHFHSHLDFSAVKHAQDIVRAILKSPGDVLGAYYFKSGRIELHWVVIWLIAEHLHVRIEDLALVVLAHEMAHFYTHIGQDADGHEWDTLQFANTEDSIVEGLAQFYTEQVLQGFDKSDNPHPLRAFKKLLPEQSDPYTCFNAWLPAHPKRSEAVRHTLVHTRAHGVEKYGDFLDLLKSSGDALASKFSK